MSDSKGPKRSSKLRPAPKNQARNGSLPWIALALFGAVGAYFSYRYTRPGPSTFASSPLVLPNATPWGYFRPPSSPSSHPSRSADIEKREAVRDAMRHSWKAYETLCWGSDECSPISGNSHNLTKEGSVGYQIVDVLDTLLVMGMDEEYTRAAHWVREELRFDLGGEFNTFETTIRILGGLLSAYHLTSISPIHSADSSMYLEKAIDLGDRLLSAYNTPSGVPLSNINLKERRGVADMGNNGLASLAEAASLQLEMKYLSEVTGDMVYWKAAERVTKNIRTLGSFDGIAPIFINPQNGQFVPSEIRLGSRGDSYYEYLLKQWLQTNKQETVYRDMYDEAMSGIKKHLIGRTKSGIMYTHELHPRQDPESKQLQWNMSPKQDHLVCFLAGSFMLGVSEGEEVAWGGLEKRDWEDMVIGEGLLEGCMKTYDTATGLGPEIAMFRIPQEDAEEEWYIKPSHGGVLIDSRNILRPETVESLFLAYRVTGDEKYREAGWEVFQAFEKHCRVPKGGYVGIEDVQQVPPKQIDRMETFWMGETLKYLYLLFDDSTAYPLDEYIFNTEAHILPIFTPSQLTDFSLA